MTESPSAAPTGANADQTTYWNTVGGPTWVALQALLDRQFTLLTAALIAALAPQPGERILDIGCGCGDTTLQIAGRVGERGVVLGADISAPMLGVARQRAKDAGLTWVDFLEADAQVSSFGGGGFDAACSRFGVMFFSDSTAAFANIRRALKPGGRLAFICWRALAENPWIALPMQAAFQHLPPPPPADPLAPGPFAFADGERVRNILSGAGFERIDITPHDARIGARNVEDAVDTAMRIGPLGALLREAPDKRETVVGALRDVFTPFDGEHGVLLPSATWIVTAS